MQRRLLELAALAAYLPASAIPALADHTRDWDPGLLVVPFCALFAISFPFWGRVADRHDRRLVIAGGLGLLAASGVVVALADSAAAAAVGRGLEGFAAAAIPPAAQAELTRSAGDARAGRAIGGMMIAVALATLGGPMLAGLLAGAGWSATVAVLAVAVPALAAVTIAWLWSAGPERPQALAQAARLRVTPGLAAGWLVSMLVLAGYWTVLTRLGTALGHEGLGASSSLTLFAPLAGALGIPLVVIAARACDRHGPRLPMLVTLAAGSASFIAAAGTSTAAAFVACAGVGLAVYWAYLPIVSVQVQRSTDAATRGRAVGWLYASMWGGAAVAGGAGALAGSWRTVLVGAGVSWALALVVTARGFLSRPATAASSTPWQPQLATQPSAR